jgi:tripartite ATP-independent transporter DctM subunit
MDTILARHRIKDGFYRSIVLIAGAVLLLMVFLPVLESIARPLFGTGISGSINYVRHGTLWVGLLGAVVAASLNRHISLGATALLPPKKKRWADCIAYSIAFLACLSLAYASLKMVVIEKDSMARIGNLIPLWVAQSVLPASFALMGISFLSKLTITLPGRMTLGALIGLFCLLFMLDISNYDLLIPGILIISLGALAGTPIFVILAGLAIVFFYSSDIPLAAISAEAYRIASNPILTTIPLFTLVGTVMTSGNASKRLVRLFRVLFGWIPGGTAVATVLVCAFFTTFTGGSGVTILAIGGLMYPILVRQKYSENFSLGVLTSSGSMGILLPPSLLIILYGVASQTPINQLFIAGILPGLILLAATSIYAIYKSDKSASSQTRFEWPELVSALMDSKWDLFLPIAMLYGIFSGKTTLVEISAFAAAYTLFTEFVIFRDLSVKNDLVNILTECSVMVGGIMVILASAMGLTNFMIFQGIPEIASEWIQSFTDSPLTFLLVLNLFLLLAGCLLDIFSAIIVIVPLILPVASTFGIDPIHLGILFLVNMELGYLTPPVGMNLYLASFRFHKPIFTVFRSALPFFLINLVVVLLVTFFPQLTVGITHWVTQ